MEKRRRILLIAVAWVVPLSWLALTLFERPSDGTVVTSPTAVLGDGRWQDSVVVLEMYGDSPLEVGDRVRSIDGVTATVAEGPQREVGEVVSYAVTRPGVLDRNLVFEVEVDRYPWAAALGEGRAQVVLAVGVLVAGTFLVRLRGREPLAVATLVLGGLAVVSLSAHPFGLQAVELAAGSVWRHMVGEIAFALGMGVLLVAATTFPTAPAWLAARPARRLIPLAVPLLAYGAWVALYAAALQGPARTQAMLDLSFPTLVAAVILAAAAVVVSYLRVQERRDRIAVRLVVFGATTAVLLLVVINFVPTLLGDEALVPWRASSLVLVPLLLVCWVVAVTRYRLLEIDSALRISLLQVALVTVVGAAFLTATGAVSLASGASVGPLLAGGVLALALLPIALLLRRVLGRVGYGERASPYRVVSTLRRLDRTTGPEPALQETLVLLSRSLGLSYARVVADDLTVSLGESRGEGTTVLLEVAGAQVGRLELEVSPLRAPFGPRDRRLLEDIGTQVGALVQALIATRDLQRSRERLVAAREEERRRLRRDLHDGLGPSLAGFQMRLELASELIDTDPAAARELVSDLAEQAHASIDEVRRLVEGLRPPALDQLGLVAALRQRAGQHGAGSGVTWTVESEPLGDLPAAVEVAAYRLTLEAVNNAVRHSCGSACVVTLNRTVDVLEVEIRDDGVGVTEDHRIGVGLGSMRERAEELGGTLTVVGRQGRGTTVRARLPLPSEEC